jgi:hypothetical protein
MEIMRQSAFNQLEAFRGALISMVERDNNSSMPLSSWSRWQQ